RARTTSSCSASVALLSNGSSTQLVGALAKPRWWLLSQSQVPIHQKTRSGKTAKAKTPAPSMDDRVEEGAESIPQPHCEGLRRLLVDQVERSSLLQNFGMRPALLASPEPDLRRGTSHVKISQHDLRQPNWKSWRHDERVQRRQRL